MRIRTQAGIVAVWLGLAVAPVPAQSSDDPAPAKQENHYAPQKGAWWTDLFGTGKPKLEGKADPHLSAAEPGTPNRSPGMRGAQMDRLMRVLFRRLEVCDRLRDVALETNDARLLGEVEQLETMVWSLHDQQCRRLGVVPGLGSSDGRSATSALQANSPGGADSRRPVRRPDASAGVREGEQ
jgi:hypothetical protein